MGIYEEALAQQDFMQAMRHELHMHPELSFQEFETTNRIERELNAMGLTCKRFEPTGLMTEIKGAHPGKTVLLRADIDALPVTEETGLPFASQTPGVMHACGHDVHTSMLLGAAKILLTHKDEIHGTVRLVFQPAEENGQGAKTIIAQGAADGVDYFFGQHVKEAIPVGSVYAAKGPRMAGAREITITVHGKGHHGGMPHQADGVDAVLAACQIVVSLQSVVSRRLNPADTGVVSIGMITAGPAPNVIPGEVVMRGTIRYRTEEVHEIIVKNMKDVIENTAKAFGATAELSLSDPFPPVINDDWASDCALAAAEKLVGKENIVPAIPTTGAEDFGNYMSHGKACFFSIGTNGKYPGHSPKLDIDENVMPYGCSMYVLTALEMLERGNKE